MQDTGPSFAIETLEAHEARAHALLDLATGALPSAALRQLDKVSRRWLEKWDNAHLAEIDAIATRLARPGRLFLLRQLRVGLHLPRGAVAGSPQRAAGPGAGLAHAGPRPCMSSRRESQGRPGRSSR